jgi:hypothetical protein
MMTSYRSVAKKLHAMCLLYPTKVPKKSESKPTRDQVRKRHQKTTVLVPKTFPARDFLN